MNGPIKPDAAQPRASEGVGLSRPRRSDSRRPTVIFMLDKWISAVWFVALTSLLPIPNYSKLINIDNSYLSGSIVWLPCFRFLWLAMNSSRSRLEEREKRGEPSL
jgi:hypothetical protein